MELTNCACTGKSLKKLLRPAVMVMLASENDGLHGYRICQLLQEMDLFHEHTPDPAGLYRTLKAMEKEGLMKSGWDTGNDGPAKRLYKLTAKGRQCMARWQKTLTEHRDNINQLLAVLETVIKSA